MPWRFGVSPLGNARNWANAELRISPRSATVPETGLTFKRARDQGRVMAAKPKGIIERDAHFLFAGNVGRVIEVAFFARVFQVYCGRNYRVTNGQCAGGHLYSTGAA